MSSHSISIRTAPLLAGNLIGILVSVVLHGFVLFLLMHHWTPVKEQREIVRPRFIEAKLLQMKPAVAQPPPPKVVEKPKVDKAAQRRVEEQKRKQQQAREQEKQRKAEQQREDARKKELQRQQLLKQEADRKRQEELKRQELARQQELQRQQELARALALEDEMLEEELNLQVGTYVDYMASLVASNWSRPPSARRDMEVLLQLTLGSKGRVIGVNVAKSSGNSAFDRSAEQAVWKVKQFTRLSEMDPALYQRDFKKMYLLFRPDDLRM